MEKFDPQDFWRSINNSALLRFILLFACGWAIVQLIDYFYSIIAMFTAAAILAVLMSYPVRYLSHFVHRGIAIAIVVLGSLAIALSFITLLGYQILTQGSSLLDSLNTALQSTNLPFKDYLDQINLEQLTNVLSSSLSTGLGLAGGLFSNTFTGIFLLVIATYMLIDGHKIWATCLRIFPNETRDYRGETLRERFDRSIQKNFLGFLQAQVTLIVFLSISSFLVFSLLGVQFSLILAVVVGVLDAIPGIGATLGVIIITVMVLLTQGHWMALKVVIASIILQQIQDNYVHPKVMGRALEINPVLVFFALFVGEKVAGLLGVFLAIPIAGMIVSWMKEDELAPDTDDPSSGTLNAGNPNAGNPNAGNPDSAPPSPPS
ncbi:MAG TPA: AI-2E family transporter [Chroococcidiopsis sp.]